MALGAIGRFSKKHAADVSPKAPLVGCFPTRGMIIVTNVYVYIYIAYFNERNSMTGSPEKKKTKNGKSIYIYYSI